MGYCRWRVVLAACSGVMAGFGSLFVGMVSAGAFFCWLGPIAFLRAASRPRSLASERAGKRASHLTC